MIIQLDWSSDQSFFMGVFKKFYGCFQKFLWVWSKNYSRPNLNSPLPIYGSIVKYDIMEQYIFVL